MISAAIDSARSVEVLHDRGQAFASGENRWTAGSGYLIGHKIVLTAAHCVDYQQEFGDDEQLLVRIIAGEKFTAKAVLVFAENSQIDLALLEITDPRFKDDLLPARFARVNRDSPEPVTHCWAVGFPQLAESGPVLPGGSHRDTWHIRGEILPGSKRRADLLALQVTSSPQPVPTSLTGSPWEGMSGSVVFATDQREGQLVVGVVIAHHLPEGESTLTVVPITAAAGAAAAAERWHQLSLPDFQAMLLVPASNSDADKLRSRLTGERALREHWDPRSRGVERAARPGSFFTGRYQALSELVTWLAEAPRAADNVRVVTGGPGSGKSAVLARLVTRSDPRHRAERAGALAADDPDAGLPVHAIDVAIHARAAPTGEIIRSISLEAGLSQSGVEGVIDELLDRPEPLTIVVDALDEADDPPALALMLRRIVSETADAGIRLLVGTRPGGPQRTLITALGLSARDDDPALIDLDNSRYLSWADLAEYVRRRLLLTGVKPIPGRPDTPYRGQDNLAAEVAEAVAHAAYPAFLIGQLVSRSLLNRDQPISPGDPGWQNFPTTVAAAMDQYLASLGSRTVQVQVEDLLRPLAYARGDGLPYDDVGIWPRLATVLAEPGRNYTKVDVVTLAETAADYLIETVITGQASYFRLYHQALADRLQKRDEQRPRPFSAAQTIYECLLSGVPRVSSGAQDWPAAHLYLQNQLAGYAADAGQLGPLLDDPGFLVVADPAELFGALQRYSQSVPDNARIYRLAYPSLTQGAGMAGQRASYLQLAARRDRASLADQIDRLPLNKPWSTRWIRGQRPHSHYIVGRHDDRVDAIAVGWRNGRSVVISASYDQTVTVWDLELSLVVLGPLEVHDDAVTAVRIARLNGRDLIVSGGLDARIEVHDLESGAQALGPLRHDDAVYAIAVSDRHGRPVIVSGGEENTVRVWDLESGQLVLGPLVGHTDCVNALVIADGNGRKVIVSGGDDEAVRVWDLESGELVLGPLTGHDGAVTSVAVGQCNGRSMIVSATAGQALWVWDLDSGERIHGPLHGHNGEVNALKIAERDGRTEIISASEDQTILVWDLCSGERVIGPFTGHDGAVNTLDTGMVQNRPVVISGSSDQTVRVWDLAAEESAVGTAVSHDGGVNALALAHRDGRPVVVSGGYDSTVRIWDMESGEPVIHPLTGHVYPVEAVAVGQRDGRSVIVSASYDSTVRIWDLQTGQPVLTPVGYGEAVHAVAVGERRGRSVIVIGGETNAVEVRDLETGQLVLDPLTGHEDTVTGVVIGNQSGRPVVISCSADETVRVWDLESGELMLRPLAGHDGTVYAVAVGERYGHQVVVSGSGDEAIRVWDLNSGDQLLERLTGHEGAVSAVAIGERHGQRVIVSGSNDDRTVQVWDLEAGGPALLHIDLQQQVMAVACDADQLLIGTTAEVLRLSLG